MSYDYEEPKFNLRTRTSLASELALDLLPADRDAWQVEPRFLGWPARFQRVHATMTEASTRLVSGLDIVLDEPEGSAQEVMGLHGMHKLGVDLVDRVEHHHRYEDNSVLPRFLRLFPDLVQAIDLLENDHLVLHDALENARSSFSILHPETSSKQEIGSARDIAVSLRRILTRHTYDEEDLLISALLDAPA